MKTLLAGVMLLALVGCYTNRELEADMVRAEVIRIDTIQRYHLNIPTKQKQITWRDSDNLEYITFVPMHAYYAIGSTMTMLRPR